MTKKYSKVQEILKITHKYPKVNESKGGPQFFFTGGDQKVTKINQKVTQKYTKVLKSTDTYSKLLISTLKYPKIPKSTQK